MPSLVSDEEKYYFTGALYDHFLTFASEFTVYKEPKLIITNSGDANILAGYNEESVPSEFTYQPESRNIMGLVMDKNNQPITNLQEITRLIQANGKTRIKVDLDGKNYIQNGKTSKIEIDGRNFNLSTYWSTQDYLGLTFYYFDIEGTN